MGFESLILLNHDCIPPSDKAEAFRHSIIHAVGQATQEPVTFNAGMAVYVDHSLASRLIAVGQHQAHILGYTTEGSPLDENVQLELLKQAADQLGYRVVKKPKKKPKESP